METILNLDQQRRTFFELLRQMREWKRLGWSRFMREIGYCGYKAASIAELGGESFFEKRRESNAGTTSRR